MALSAQLPTYSQVNDRGRCGFHNYYNCSIPHDADAVARTAGERLLAAASTGTAVTQAMRCIADGADLNYSDPSTGETALHRAVQRKQLQLLDLLLAAGANPNCRDRRDRTPLFCAASAGELQCVQKLLASHAHLFPHPSPAPHHLPATGASASTTTAAASPNDAEPDATETASAASDDDDAVLLALRATCPLAAAAAAAHWPVVAALLGALPPHYQRLRPALRSLRFLVWALASHKAFPREVIHRLPRRLPRCVVDAVRPAHIASTPLVLASGNDQQQLMQWLLLQGADPELGAPLLLCAGRFCRGSRTCCVNTLLRRGARPHVAWADDPSDSPLQLAARGDCFTHVHCLVAYGADVAGEAARVREALYAPAPWEVNLDALMRQYGNLVSAPGADLLCPCGQQHARWPGLWPLEGEEGAEEQGGATAATGVAEAGDVEVPGGAPTAAEAEAGAGGNSCHNLTPSDDAWYRHHRAQMEQLQDGSELGECRKAVDDLWRYGCSAVLAQMGGAPAAPHSLLPQRVLAALQDVAGGWLVAAARCRHQRQLRLDLYDKAVAAGRVLLDRKRVAALVALGGGGRAPCPGSGGVGGSNPDGAGPVPETMPTQRAGGVDLGSGSGSAGAGAEGGLALELRMEILALAGLAPPEVQAWAVSAAVKGPCGCDGCSSS